MALNGSVDFTIRATDLTTKPTRDIVNALEQLADAQKDVARSADDLSTSSSRLTQEQKALAAVQVELDRRLTDVSKYEKNKDALAEYVQQLNVAQNALDGFRVAFFNANDSGSKDVIRTATDNLKVAQKNVEQLRAQIAALQNQQRGLESRAAQRGGVDLTQGGTARELLETANAQAQAARQQNIADQQHNAALAEQIKLERAAQVIADQRARDQAAFDAQAAKATTQNQRNQYELMYARLLDEQEAQLKEQQTLEAKLTQEAKDRAAAEKTAADQLQRFNDIGSKALTNLNAGQAARAAASPNAAVTGGNARQGVDEALDPLKAKTSTLDGVEKTLKEVGAAIDQVGDKSVTAKQKIDSLEQAQEKLAAAGKALGTQAGLTDALTKQNAATEQAERNLREAEAEVERLANQIKNATVADDALVASLQNAQGRLASAAATMRTQADSLERVRTSAASAGINVGNLAGEEARLAEAARNTATAQTQVGEALDKVKNQSGGLGAAFEKLGGSGRQSLSLFQRIRGEVIALTASFVGVQAGIGALGSVLDVVKTDQAVRAQIAQTTNSPEEQAKQYAFLRGEAERTGFSFETVSKSYALMARQALEYGLAQNTVNKLFSDGLTVGRSFNQSGEQLEGTFTALGQIFDKTTIQSEEFKKQLSNQGLAGLFPTLAKVMQDQGVKSIQDVQKAMENAQVPAAEIVKVFDALAKSGNVAFNQNMQGYAAKLNAFKTQLYEIQLQFAGGGFLDGVNQGLTALSATLAKPETQQNLRELGKLVGDLIAGFAQWASNVDNIKGVLTVLEVYLSGKLIVTVATLGANILKIGAAGTTAAEGLTAMGGAAGTLGAVLGTATTVGVVASVLALGVGLGILLDKIPAVRAQTEALANMSEWEKLKKLGPLYGVVATAQGIGTGIAAVQAKIQGDGRDDAQAAATDRYLDKLNQINVKKRQGLALTEEEQKIVDKIADKQLANAFATSVPGKPGSKTGVDQSSADLDTQRKLAEAQVDSINKAADTLNRAAEKKELKSRKDFLELYQLQNKDAVDNATRTVAQLQAAFDKTGSDVDKQALDSAKKAQAALNAGIQTRADADYAVANAAAAKKKSAADEAYETKRQSLHEQTNAAILAGDTKLAALTAKQDDDSLDARLKKVDAELAQEYAKLEVQIRKNNDAIAAGKKLGLDTSQLQQDNASLEAAQKRLDVNKQIADILATQGFFMDQATKDEQEINTKIQLRAAMLASIQALQKSGNISSEDATRAAKTVDNNTLDGEGGINDLFSKRIAANQAEIEDQIALGNATTEYTQKLELQNAQLEANRASLDATRATTSQFAQDINKIVSGDIVQGIDSVAQEINKLAQGTESWGEAWKNVGNIILNTIADILIAIGEYIIKQQILNALKKEEGQSSGGQGGGGGYSGIISSVISYLGSSSHTGGLVGQASSGVGGATPRLVNPSWFKNAPRFHTGGMPGLAPDEYPIIAQKGEEVITRNDPRNRLNQKNSTSEVGAMGGGTDVHFHADAPSFFSAGLNSRPGKQQLFAFFSANKQSISRLLNTNGK